MGAFLKIIRNKMDCIIEYKNINFRINLLDFRFTYKMDDMGAGYYTSNIVFYEDQNTMYNLEMIMDDMAKSYNKVSSRIIINHKSKSYVLYNFIIKEISIDSDYNTRSTIDMDIGFDYLENHENYELMMRSQKLKKILNKINND